MNRTAAPLFVIRHAHAVDGEPDELRALSEKGRHQARALGRFLAGNGALEVAELWHSPLARAVETAEILRREAGLKARFVEIAGLEPMGSPRTTASRIMAFAQPLAVVGHEPHLSALVSLLLGGTTTAIQIEMKKCACVALARTPEGWALNWMLVPKLLERG